MISVSEMRALEDSSGIPKDVLMDHAGRAAAQALREKFDIKNKNILIVCYHGNNGGDGFVMARKLCDEAEVDVLFAGDEARLKGPALRNYRRLQDHIMIQMVDMDDVDFSDYNFIVDCIFGTGIHAEIREPILSLINSLNKAEAVKISIDVPSGVDPDTGQKANVYFEPDFLITFHDMKQGLEEYSDRAVVVDIGLGNVLNNPEI
ncbi:NAD(P)H-hydrate epimerase [Candidatus Woesearchaeota archaeon]|nr:NAD(P)H-hydrate epimerase [Candidatus Woesearchaeota archaeon]